MAIFWVENHKILVSFILTGRQLGSGFGTSLEVLDLNGDGFDDLLVGAPFEYHRDESGKERGGAVYVFFSRGARQTRGKGQQQYAVFRKPLVLRGRSAHSQFGAALGRLGNLDNDANGYQGGHSRRDGQTIPSFFLLKISPLVRPMSRGVGRFLSSMGQSASTSR